MRRADFIRLAATAAGGTALGTGFAPGLSPAFAALPDSSRPRGSLDDLRINGGRLNAALEALSRFGALPGGGITRVAFSDADRAGRDWALEWMAAAGLETHIDAAGNLVGRRAGLEPGLAPILMGSHIDSVPEGGNYDGPLGSLAAIEIARVLAEEGIRTRHPLEVLLFSNEEAGKTGSRALAGEIGSAELALPSASAGTLAEGIFSIGGNPDALASVRRAPGSATAYLELHVEQGGILEAEGIPVGVVEGIVGIRRWNIQVDGFANHAGTTPMDARQDALVAAARFVDQVHRIARDTEGRQVATVGRLEVSPGAPNVIPGRVRLSLEIRDLDMEKIDALHEAMRAASDEVAAATGTTFAFAPNYLSRSALMAAPVQDAIEEVTGTLGVRSRRMPSGAGHDAQSIAAFAPAGMIFVPSRGGISHAPDEYTSPEQVELGGNVLLQTLLRLDANPPG